MATARPIKREKEGWLGVALTALGCAAFLAWWFWPREAGPAAGLREATPENLLEAALEARITGTAPGELDSDLLVLALQAIGTGETALTAKARAAMEDNALRNLVGDVAGVAAGAAGAPAAAMAEDSPLESLLAEGHVNDAIASLEQLADSAARQEATLRIAAFLSQGGEIDRARELLATHPPEVAESPAAAVDLHLRLAGLHGQWGAYDEAASELNAASSAASSPSDILRVARQCYSLNLFDEGARLLKVAEARASGDPALAQSVASAYLELGETERARAVAEQAMEKGGPASWELLAMKIALAAGDAAGFGRAVEWWRNLRDPGLRADAARAMHAFVSGQLQATEAPPWLWQPATGADAEAVSRGETLRIAVDANQPEVAAAAIETWHAPADRARGYLVLARLLLWRHTAAAAEIPR